MYFTGLEAGILFVAGASAAVLRSPIEVRNGNNLNLQPSLAGNGNFQRVLGSPPSGAHSTGVPIRDFMNIIYTANISIGTPPQYFSVAVDTMSSELLVPSASCNFHCDQAEHRYNSSLSSTYVANGSYSNVKWAAINYSGYLSRDVVRIGGVEAADQMFEEWTSAMAYSIGAWEYGYDGIIGLAPPWRLQGGSYMPNTLSGLLPQLDALIFSLKLPTKEGDQGELLLGATNRDLYISEPTTVPLSNHTDSFFPASWTLPAEAITFNSQVPLQTTCGSSDWGPGPCNALIDSSIPYIMLPHTLAANITAAVGARPGPLWFYNIPCERRQELPTLTVTLGGHNFSISAFEYTLEVEIPHQGVTCLVSIMDESDFSLPRPWNGIILGNPFIRGFYSVFDMEKREIGFAELKK